MLHVPARLSHHQAFTFTLTQIQIFLLLGSQEFYGIEVYCLHVQLKLG